MCLALRIALRTAALGEVKKLENYSPKVQAENCPPRGSIGPDLLLPGIPSEVSGRGKAIDDLELAAQVAGGAKAAGFGGFGNGTARAA